MKNEQVKAPPRPRGFAAIDKARHREIAAAGGRAAHERGVAHEYTSEEARAAGHKGGTAVSQDREYMSRIGRKGGLARVAILSKADDSVDESCT